MPSLQQQTPNFKDCSLASDILQKHSINSLLEHSDDLILSPTRLSASPEVDANLPFVDIFNIGTSTPKGYSSPDNNNFVQTTSKMFDNFQFDNRSLQRNLSFDCNVTSPTSPNSAKIYTNSYGNDSGFYNNSRSDSPMINEGQDMSSPTFEQRSLAELMNFLNVNAAIQQQPQSPYYEQHNQRNKQQQIADFKQMQTLHLLQQQQQQIQQQLNIELNMAAAAAAAQQPLNQMLISRFNQIGLAANLRSQQQQNHHHAQQHQQGNALDNAAKYHRSSAALYDPSCTWSGVLPPRSGRFITYSPKVFLGGIPWDISEQTLIQIFKPFGQIKIEWPGKEQNAAQPKGYVYVIFESEKQVKALLQACNIQDNFLNGSSGSADSYSSSSDGSINCGNATIGNTNGNYYYKISSKRIKEKEVEVIPWIIGDSNYIKAANQKIESGKTVFVGALHGKLTAEGLAKIMNDLFDGVVYAGIDTDKYKYPIGSGRVTFNNTRSYMRAVAAAFIEIKTSKFSKKVQIDPYLEDALCSMCGVQHGPYYCRELSCFRYFCRPCWQMRHANTDTHLRNHKPLTRNSKTQQQINHAHNAMYGGGSISTSSGSSTASTSTPNSPNDQVLLNFQMK